MKGPLLSIEGRQRLKTMMGSKQTLFKPATQGLFGEGIGSGCKPEALTGVGCQAYPQPKAGRFRV